VERSIDIGVLGAGSFGTALAKLLADKGHTVTLWTRAEAAARAMQDSRENARYLPGARLPDNLRVTHDLGDAIAGRPLVLTVAPSHATRETLRAARAHFGADTIVVSASKGIENESLATMDEVLAAELPPGPAARTAFLSGPSFAKEVAAGLPTAVVAAARDASVATAVQTAFATDRLRVYTETDVIGVELGGALKNVIAIAAGMGDGLGFGHNTRAAVITRGLAEISRLGVRMGASPLTFMGLAGMGDLVLTCTGDLSRNRSVGLALGRGQTLAQILADMKGQVAEGVKTTRSARDLARKLGVEMPITEAMYAVLYEDRPARQAVSDLMGRAQKHERG
jgi:glycerol-3-phosphate dehydrogenase (NAD(P)+)